MSAWREALLHRDRKAREDKLKLDEYGGRPYLRLDEERFVTMATSQVALIGKRKVIDRFLASRSVAPKTRSRGSRRPGSTAGA